MRGSTGTPSPPLNNIESSTWWDNYCTLVTSCLGGPMVGCFPHPAVMALAVFGATCRPSRVCRSFSAVPTHLRCSPFFAFGGQGPTEKLLFPYL